MSGLTIEQKNEIVLARSEARPTLRPTVSALEEWMHRAIPVLDHGFVRLVDYMGDDSAIVQAARVSYGRGTKTLTEDEGLIRYLMRHRHSTPFEMCEIKVHCKMPIFVARQWIRHRTANVNEASARYSIMDKEFYIPESAQLAVQSTANRQGRGEVLDPQQAEDVQHLLLRDAEQNYRSYEWMLNEDEHGLPLDRSRPGLARELARMNLTLNTYTQWYWKVDLHNLLGFLSLRADSHAQYEIRVYADVLLDLVKTWVPMTHRAFLDYRLGAVTLSAQMVQVVHRKMLGEKVTQADSGLSKREWSDFKAAMQLTD
ncbi:FAD-dependent thymidylate synthase [Roseococcus pinisoli]|uniref:Flavin-dependent thymidylate synthase n=1 Tax=Roseococcus pinisoli TaxID=2835040 RepID=A0ABS5QHF7_9PROT|nr:FAD-dependent thymidylate synthase [Roseococcus pinisoli]MBS7812390.1 FAD-dependent thymidylate synthase [Roseococcus pinisoli]